MSELVEKLSQGVHPVEISLRPDRTVSAFKRCIDQGYTHVKFTETRGGTDLYVPLDTAATDISSADFDSETGIVKLIGKLTLDYVPVRCLAEIDLATLAGTGRLQRISDESTKVA